MIVIINLKKIFELKDLHEDTVCIEVFVKYQYNVKILIIKERLLFKLIVYYKGTYIVLKCNNIFITTHALLSSIKKLLLKILDLILIINELFPKVD